jgi:hypothetical protein
MEDLSEERGVLSDGAEVLTKTMRNGPKECRDGESWAFA